MKIDRLIGILSILLQQEKITAPELAKKFEVSRRTINRDIENLCKAGIPIVTKQGQNGGISIIDGYKIDKTLLTSSDMQAILSGLGSLDSVSGTNQVSILMEKLGASNFISGNPNILIDLSSWYKDSLSPKIEQIKKAIEQNKLISFVYYAPKGESSRIIEPYYLVFHWSSWYVWGYCRKRDDYRLFKLNRMTHLNTKEIFEKRVVPTPDLSTEKIFNHKYEIRAIIKPEYRWRLIDEYGLESFTVMQDGNLLFSFMFTDEQSIINWILSFKGAAELIYPDNLRKVLKKLGQQIQKQYSNS